MADTNRLYRSTSDKVIGGVAGGLGNYMNIDPVIVRILFVLMAIFGGSGVLVYIIMWIIIPEQKYRFGTEIPNNPQPTAGINDKDTSTRTNTSLIAGIVLIAFGLLFLIDRLVPYYSIHDFWPLLLILAGALLIKPEIFKSSNKSVEPSKEVES